MDSHNQQQPVTIYKRQQHNLKLANVLNNMLQCGSLVDVTIYCDDGEVSAHKLVLAASSSYFRNLFSRITNAFQSPIIVLREIPANDLRTILQFIYHGEIHIPQNRVESLMRCANYLQIDGMASSTNALNAVLASSTMSSGQLLMPAVSIISNQNVASSSITNTGQLQTFNTKFHPQYITPTNCTPNTNTTNNNNIAPTKQSRGHSSRSNYQNQSSNNSTNTNTTNNNASNSSNNGKPRHTCTTCYKTFTHGFTLQRHIKALHSDRRITYRCDVCNKDYSCKDSYLRHKRSSNHMQHTEFTNRNNMNIGT